MAQSEKREQDLVQAHRLQEKEEAWNKLEFRHYDHMNIVGGATRETEI